MSAGAAARARTVTKIAARVGHSVEPLRTIVLLEDPLRSKIRILRHSAH
jgi:hypothetical protein